MDYFDLGQQTTTTTGTGTITLGAPVAGYRGLGSAQDGLTYRYLIRDGGTGGWEAGSTTYTHAGTSMTRTVMYSSNANAAINLSGTNVVVSLGSVSAVDLAQIVSDIATNAADITTNAGDIATNTTAIADHETRISDLETFEGTATTDIANNAAAILVNAGDIDDLETFQATIEGIFAGAIADGTYTTAAGDQIVTVNGLVTSFTVGTYSLPDDDGTSGQVLTTDGAGNWTWQDASGGTTLTLVEEAGTALRPVTDSATTSGDASHAWLNGYYDAITLGGVDLDTRIGTAEADIATNAGDIATNAAAILVNAGDIDDLETFQASATASIAANASDIDDLETFQATTEAIFAGAIADDDYLTSTNDQFTITDGIITGYTKGLMQYPSSSFGSGYALVSTSATTSAWQKVVYQYWEETIGGYLVPKTTSVYDLGSSTKKVRDLHLSRNAIIDNNVTVGGSLTVAAVSIVPELVSLNSWLYDNTLDIAELQASVSAGKAGLRISRSSTTQISIAAGRIHNHDISKSIVVDSPITLDLTDSGDFVNGAIRATATWFHILLGHLTSDGSVVAALSTTRAKPAAWDDWQIIGAVPTNTTGSGEWVLFEQHGNEFLAVEEIISYSNTSPGTSELTIRAWCPPGNYPVTCQLRNWGGSASAYIVLRRAAGGAAVDAGYIQASTPMNWPARCTTDASGNIYLIIGTTITFSEFRVHGKSYTYPIGEAGAV